MITFLKNENILQSGDSFWKLENVLEIEDIFPKWEKIWKVRAIIRTLLEVGGIFGGEDMLESDNIFVE